MTEARQLSSAIGDLDGDQLASPGQLELFDTRERVERKLAVCARRVRLRV